MDMPVGKVLVIFNIFFLYLNKKFLKNNKKIKNNLNELIKCQFFNIFNNNTVNIFYIEIKNLFFYLYKKSLGGSILQWHNEE